MEFLQTLPQWQGVIILGIIIQAVFQAIRVAVGEGPKRTVILERLAPALVLAMGAGYGWVDPALGVDDGILAGASSAATFALFHKTLGVPTILRTGGQVAKK